MLQVLNVGKTKKNPVSENARRIPIFPRALSPLFLSPSRMHPDPFPSATVCWSELGLTGEQAAVLSIASFALGMAPPCPSLLLLAAASVQAFPKGKIQALRSARLGKCPFCENARRSQSFQRPSRFFFFFFCICSQPGRARDCTRPVAIVCSRLAPPAVGRCCAWLIDLVWY